MSIPIIETTPPAKPAYQSTAVWGALAAIAPQALELAGITDPGAVNNIVTIAGAVVAIYGRWRAKQPLRAM